MRLVRLIYASKLSEKTPPEEIEEILATARERNAAQGISGILCFDTEFFLQTLEGPRGAVNLLYKDILSDPRHTDAILIDYREVPHREFGRWNMAYVTTVKAHQDIVFKYSPLREFDPYVLPGDAALAFLKEMAQAQRAHLGDSGGV